MKFQTVIASILFCSTAFAQQPETFECGKIIDLLDSNTRSIVSINSAGGACGGRDYNFQESKWETICTGGQNPLRFVAKNDGMLRFDIVSNDPKETYGFYIYHCNERNYESAGDFGEIPLREVNLSKTKGRVGLSDSAKKSDRYVAVLPIKAGEAFFIYVFCVKSCADQKYGAGFKINFHTDIGKYVQPVVFSKLVFETGKTTIQANSTKELNDLALKMKANSKMKISITGHTDNIGKENENIILSQGRAKAVYDFLITKGVKAAQLSFKGYGSSIPIADNKTEEGKAKNRRVEFQILSE